MCIRDSGAAHPAVTTQALRLEPPTLADARSDLERFDEALGGVSVSLAVLDRLPDVLREGKWRVVVIRYGKRIVDVSPGEAPVPLYGVAAVSYTHLRAHETPEHL